MSPRTADPRTRAALLDAAARLLQDEGSQALTTRRLADAVGVSTTAVYTHFQGMPELRQALRAEGFARFFTYLQHVRAWDDPGSEIIALGDAYRENAAANPQLYRFMFMEEPCDAEMDSGTFERLVAAVQRALDAGRFRGGEAYGLAMQLWVAEHGTVTLLLAGMMSLDDAVGLTDATALTQFVGFGDDPDAAQRSLQAVRARRGTAPGGEHP
jgi:AcrR family transcriptional regulator